MSTDTTTVSSAEAQYNEDIANYYTEATEDLDTMAAAEDQIEEDQDTITAANNQAKEDSDTMDDYIRAGEACPASVQQDYKEQEAIITSATDDITYQNDVVIQGAEDDLESMGAMGANFASLEQSEEELNEVAADVALMCSGTDKSYTTGELSIAGSQSAMDQWKSAMDQIMLSMQQQLEANYDYCMMTGDTGLTTSETETYANEYAQIENGLNSTLMSLVSELDKDLVYWNGIYDANNEQKSSFDFLDKAFGDGVEAVNAAEKMMDFAVKMKNTFLQVMHDLSGAIGTSAVASLLPLIMILKNAEEEVIAIMNDPTLSNTEKAANILAILFSMLGFLDAFKGQVEALKAKNEQLMAEGTLDSSQMQIQDAQSATVIQQEEQRNAKVMQIFSTCLTAIMTLAMCVTAQWELAVVIVAFSSYDLYTTWNPDAKTMSDILGGGVLGDVSWSAIEAVGSMGAACALEKATAYLFAERTLQAPAAATSAGARSAAEEEAKAIEAASSSSAALDEAEELAANPDQVHSDARVGELKPHATEIAEERLRLTLKYVQQSGARLYSRQAIGSILWDMGKAFFRGSDSVAFKATMQNVRRTATEKSLQFSENVASGGYQIGSQELDMEARNLAAQSVSQGLGVEEATAKNAIDGSTTLPYVGTVSSTTTMAIRTALMFFMLTMMNNTLVDALKSSDKQWLNIIMMVTQVLMTIIAGIVLAQGCVSLRGNSTNWMRIANISTQCAQGASVGVQYSNSQNQIAQGLTIVQIEIDREIQDILYQLLTQIQKTYAEDSNAMSKQMAADGQRTQTAQKNSLTSVREAIEVLLSSSV